MIDAVLDMIVESMALFLKLALGSLLWALCGLAVVATLRFVGCGLRRRREAPRKGT